MPSATPSHAQERVGLGLVLTALQLLVYFAFVAACCFDPGFASGAATRSGVPYAFLCGLAVIATGVVLTVVYVVLTNRKEALK